jgi:hypothetical protein
MIINVNNQVALDCAYAIVSVLILLQDDSIKRMDSFALEQLQQW